MKEADTQKDKWIEEFDRKWSHTTVDTEWYGTHFLADIKSFISNLLQEERAKVIKEMDEELKKLPRVVVNRLSEGDTPLTNEGRDT